MKKWLKLIKNKINIIFFKKNKKKFKKPLTSLIIHGNIVLVSERVTQKTKIIISGRLAQLVRAPALQAGGHRFESCIAHHVPE